jgi:hypothetical protein
MTTFVYSNSQGKAIMPRKRHANKDIEDALAHAESQGWRIEKSRGHAWGRMYCPFNDADCRCGEFCVASIWSTPEMRRIMQSRFAAL